MSAFWKGVVGALIGTLLAGSILGFSSWVAMQVIETKEDVTKIGISINSLQTVLVDRIERLSIENARLRNVKKVSHPAGANGGGDEQPQQQDHNQDQDWPDVEEEYSKKGILKDIYEQTQQQQQFQK